MNVVVVPALALVAAVAALVLFRFQRAHAAAIQGLEARSEVAQTRVGPVEFALHDGPGPTILASHGSPGGFDAFWPIEGHRTLVPSRPGYLRTPLASGCTPAEQADAFAALLEHLEPRIGSEPVVVIGASGGAPAALAFASRHPDRTRALVVAMGISGPISLPSFPRVPGLELLVWSLGTVFWRAFGAPGVARKMVPDAANRNRLLADGVATDRLMQLMAANWPLVPRVDGSNNDALQFRDLSLDLASIRAPTLVVHGTADTNVPFEHGERTATEVPGAEFLRVDGADHFVTFTHRSLFDEALGKVL